MSIQQDYKLNFDHKDVYAFLQDSARTRWDEPIPVRTGYTLSTIGEKLAGSTQPGMNVVEQDEDGNTVNKTLTGPLNLTWAAHEFYEVVEGYDPATSNNGTVVGTFDVYVPMTQPVTVTIYSSLRNKTGISAQQKKEIEDAFKAYDYATDGDALDYMAKKLASSASVKATMFDVVSS